MRLDSESDRLGLLRQRLRKQCQQHELLENQLNALLNNDVDDSNDVVQMHTQHDCSDKRRMKP